MVANFYVLWTRRCNHPHIRLSETFGAGPINATAGARDESNLSVKYS